MSEEFDISQFRQKGLTDYMDQAVKLLYVIGAVLFVAGLWVDWQNPGTVVIAPFVFAEEPHENSGLFVAAILVFFFGFIVSRTANWIDNRNREEIEDQTQEWVVDVRADR